MAIRAPRGDIALRGHGLEAAVAVSALLQVLAVAWGPLRDLLGTTTILGADALVILCLSALPAAVLASVRALKGTKGQRDLPVRDLRP